MPRQRGGALHEDYMNRFYELLHEARVRAPRLVGLWLNILLDEETPRIKRRSDLTRCAGPARGGRTGAAGSSSAISCTIWIFDLDLSYRMTA